MTRKGFPESYDRRALLRFVTEVKAGRAEVTRAGVLAPGLRHRARRAARRAPPGHPAARGAQRAAARAAGAGRHAALAVSDFIDFSVYVDAATDDIRRWYVERFLRLRETAFREPDVVLPPLRRADRGEAVARAESIWAEINGPNLEHNIMPTRGRASLVLRKGPDHNVTRRPAAQGLTPATGGPGHRPELARCADDRAGPRAGRAVDPTSSTELAARLRLAVGPAEPPDPDRRARVHPAAAAVRPGHRGAARPAAALRAGPPGGGDRADDEQGARPRSTSRAWSSAPPTRHDARGVLIVLSDARCGGGWTRCAATGPR